MHESDRGHPIQAALIVLLLVGGGWYFLRHYEIAGFEDLVILPKAREERTLVTGSTRDRLGQGDQLMALDRVGAGIARNSSPSQLISDPGKSFSFSDLGANRYQKRGNLKIASWALDGFGPTKLSNSLARQNLAKVIRNFDLVALQQIASVERDLIPRLVDAINHGETRYEYVISEPTGPKDRPEQLAFIFDTSRLQVDRRQTYTSVSAI